MKATKKQAFTEITSEPDISGKLLIYARRKKDGQNVILATYSKKDGLKEMYYLKSVLTKYQQSQLGRLIDRYHPEGAYHGRQQ